MEILEKHRVRLFTFQEKELSDKDDIFWKCADMFQVDEKYKWAERAGVKLEWSLDKDSRWFDGYLALIYADLDDAQYSDYILNFFDEEAEWK
jgi:hypothetical protein|tara:strand:+ start:137 stop:412 length:276 start_codon:yes stop_codon:yes gene_type:complete